MVDSVKDIDKNKIAILLSETQEIAFYILMSKMYNWHSLIRWVYGFIALGMSYRIF